MPKKGRRSRGGRSAFTGVVPYEEISERDMAGSREGQGNVRVGLDAEGAVAGKGRRGRDGGRSAISEAKGRGRFVMTERKAAWRV